MADGNWGAQTSTDPTMYLVSSKLPDYQNDQQFTITILKPWVENQQPAHIQALADQFQKAYDLLIDLEKAVRDHSTKLYNESWTKADAREEFMKRGPGLVLAYVQEWQRRVLLNRDGLHMLIDPIRKSQVDMEILWRKYNADVASAGDRNNLSFGDELSHSGINWYDGVGVMAYKYFNNDDQINAFLIERVEKVRKYYDQQARNLVHTLSGAYADAMLKMIGGVGPVYKPPNVTMMPPGQKLDVPGGPGAPPGLPGAPPAVPVLNPLALPPLPPPAPAPPVVPVAPNLPNVPTAPTVPNNPPNLQGLPGAPGLDPSALPVGLAAGFLPGALPGGLGLNPSAGTGFNPGAGPGLGGMTPPPALGKGLRKGVLRGRSAEPGFGLTPPPAAATRRRNNNAGSTLRSPAARYTATSGMLPPAAPNLARRRDTPNALGPGGRHGVSEAFSRGSLPPPVAPVLGKSTARQRADAVPTPRGALSPPNAVPPVLGSRARPAAGSAGMALPPGGIPPQRTRRRQTTDAPVASPVLRNLAGRYTGDVGSVARPTQPGATSPVLGRARDAVREALAENRARHTPVEADLTRRAIEADHLGQPAVDEQPQVRDGEEAFTVRTPGGPVVGNPQADPKATPGV